MSGVAWVRTVRAARRLLRQVSQGVMTTGDVAAVIENTMRLQGGVMRLSRAAVTFSKALDSGQALLERTARRPAIRSGVGERPSEEGFRGEVRFEGVRFSYPSRPEQPVLRGLDLRLRPGATVALVGPSGSGKSTVGALLERFYDCDEGSITLDGHELRALDHGLGCEHAANPLLIDADCEAAVDGRARRGLQPGR